MRKDQALRLPETTGPAGRSRSLVLAALAALCLFAFLVTPAARADSTGDISGTVTDAISGVKVANVQVNVYDATSGSRIVSQCTRSAGTYDIAGLAPGTYKVGFESTEGDFKVCGGVTNYLPQFWHARVDLSSADVVTVTAGTTTSGIDAALLPGGAIAGTVTDAVTGHPLSAIEVDALDAGGNLVSSTCTASDGSYSVYALAKGSYRVEFQNSSTCGNPVSYRTQYYLAQSSLATAQAVPVVTSSTTTGVDAAMVPSNATVLSVAIGGTGTGAVHLNPPGADCSRSCAHAYVAGTAVTLTATPAAGSSFAGWTGACNGTGGCTVTMATDQAVGATFKPSSGPSHWGNPAPRCALKLKSPNVLVRARKPAKLKKGHAVKPSALKVGQLALGYTCSQAARLYVTGSVSYTLRAPKHTAHGRKAKARVRSVSLKQLRLTARAGAGALTVTLPSALVKLLAGRTKLTVRFVGACVNGNGSGSARTASVRLRPAR